MSTVMRCEACGARKDVTSMRGVRSDQMNVDVDLCRKCWARLETEYGFEVTRRSTRKTFQVVDEKDI